MTLMNEGIMREKNPQANVVTYPKKGYMLCDGTDLNVLTKIPLFIQIILNCIFCESMFS